MRKFWKISKKPLVVAIIASILYVIDALIGGLFAEGGSFMWVAFAFWTVFFGATIKDRIKGLIGTVIGFIAGIAMMLITKSFNLNLGTISISCLLGVFVINLLVMYLEKADKIWLNSITGVFVGIFLTFSGLGVGFNPIASFKECGIMFGALIVYAILGMLCGYFTLLFTKKAQETTQSKDKEYK